MRLVLGSRRTAAVARAPSAASALPAAQDRDADAPRNIARTRASRQFQVHRGGSAPARKDGARTRHVGACLGTRTLVHLYPPLYLLCSSHAQRQQPSARSSARRSLDWTGAARLRLPRAGEEGYSVHGSRRRGWDDMPPLAFLRSLPARLLERVCDGVRGSPGAVRDEESGGSGRSSASAGHPAGECYACTQPGVPAFHSTTCDQVHEPGWDADAGSSLVPVQAQQAPPASAAQHAGAAARWLFGPVLDPRSKRVRRWNRWILLGRAAALAVDPLFFYALSIGRAGQPCLYMDAGLAAAVTALRTCADAAHLAHVLLQFRLAYVSRESLVVGCGKLVWDARAIAAHYARSAKGLWFDLFVILPIPQVIFWLVIPKLIREEQVKLIMTILLLMFIFQFLPKVYHSIHIMRKMQKVTGYIFGTIWWGFGLNLFAYFIASHDECKKNNSCDLISLACSKEICFRPSWSSNINGFACDTNVTSSGQQNLSTCLSGNGSFAYGIYLGALPVISSNSLAVKILYPIFWGLMTLSTFGNDLAPTSNGLEVIFSIINVLSGLMLFTLLIGNIQVPLFHGMDDLILDNICDRLRPLVFSSGEKVIREGDPVQRMVFILQGKLRSTQPLTKGVVATCMLGAGNFLGDELLSWCLRRPFVDRLPASSATFECVEAAQAFCLDAPDLRFITEHFRYKFANEKLKHTARYYSSNWRTWAAVNIQLAWRRYRARKVDATAVVAPPPAAGPDDGDRRLRHYAAMFMSLRPHDHLE
ncbi:cyclic nucleotide-gated ion channel 2 [Panicum miliaceum]|uniref:Cyclic nucleotide-gated ion channel 2 n=1 Tax=Panicum miliaceum TaxID=4540 RepID=A0A3L6SCP8_PANMI|nr:cyclic nucleotide-gated ion channel 2 [Panicum miliaceum]